VCCTNDFSCVADGSIPDLRIVAHKSLLGRVQAPSGLRVPLDLHDDGPLTVEHVDRSDAAPFARLHKGFFHLREHLRQTNWGDRCHRLP
jgi:hypothetical protein